MADGLFLVSLVHRFYESVPRTTTEFSETLKGHEFLVPTIQVKKLDAGTDVQQLQKSWQAQAQKQLWQTVLYWLLETCSLLVCLLLTYTTVKQFRQSVSSYFEGKARLLNIAKPLLAQLALFIGIAVFLAVISPIGPFLISLMLPVLLLVWIFELFIFGICRYRQPREPVK